MRLTQALHALGFDKKKQAVPSAYNYRTEDGKWICTVWRDRLDYDAAFAHINIANRNSFQIGDQVRVVLIERAWTEDGRSSVANAEPDECSWSVEAIIPPTKGFKRWRAVPIRNAPGQFSKN